jgi:hypothetical protein
MFSAEVQELMCLVAGGLVCTKVHELGCFLSLLFSFPSLLQCNGAFPGRHEPVNGPAACFGKFLAVAFLLGTSPFLPGNSQSLT